MSTGLPAPGATAGGPASGAGGKTARAFGAARAVVGATPLLWMMPAIALQSMLMVLEPAAPGLAGPGGTAGLSPFQALVALALIGAGGWLIRSGAHELEWNATPACVEETARALVATGPYRLSRHPMYLGAVSVLLGVAVALGSVLAALVAAGFALWIERCHVRREEARLHGRFGPAWRAYAARVRRWL